MKARQRVLAMLLALVMMLGMLPISAFAQDSEEATPENVQEEVIREEQETVVQAETELSGQNNETEIDDSQADDSEPESQWTDDVPTEEQEIVTDTAMTAEEEVLLSEASYDSVEPAEEIAAQNVEAQSSRVMTLTGAAGEKTNEWEDEAAVYYNYLLIAESGEEVSLWVQVGGLSDEEMASVTYQWTKRVMSEQGTMTSVPTGETGAAFPTFVLEEDCSYQCRIAYGHEEYIFVAFDIWAGTPEPAEPLTAEELAALTAKMADALRMDREYVALSSEDAGVQLTVLGIPDELSELVTTDWMITDGELGLLPDGVVQVDDTGLVTPVPGREGTAFVTAAVRLGEQVWNVHCRVDVTKGTIAETVTGVSLATDKATVELYKTEYTRIPVVLAFPQNISYQSAAGSNSVSAEERRGVAITGAEFTDSDTKKLFSLRVADDRTLEIIPVDGAFYVDAAGKVVTQAKGSYKSAIKVTGENWEATTNVLAITVKKTLPSVKASVGKFNTFIPGDSKAIVFSLVGTGIVSADNSQALWLDCDKNTGTLTLNERALTMKSASGKLVLKVHAEGWDEKIVNTVSLSVSGGRTAPKLTFSPNTLTLNPAAGDEVKTVAAVNMAEYQNAPITLSRITPKGSYPSTGLIPSPQAENGVITVTTDDSFDASTAKTFQVFYWIGQEDNIYSFTVKTLEVQKAPPSFTLKASGTIDTGIPGSSVTITVTPKNYTTATYNVTAIYQYDASSKKYDIDAMDLFLFDDPLVGNKLTLKQNSNPDDPDRTLTAGKYQLTVSTTVADKELTKDLVFTVKGTDRNKVPPSVTLKAAGKLDVIRPESFITLTPTYKNWYGHELSVNDLFFCTGTGAKAPEITDPDKIPFDVMVAENTFIISIKNGKTIDPKTEKYSVGMRDGAKPGSAPLTKSPIALTITMGSAKFTQSTKTVELLRYDRYSSAVFSIVGTDSQLSEIDRVELVKNKNSAPFKLEDLGKGNCAVHYAGFDESRLPAKTKSAKLSLKVFLKGNGTTTANATLSLTVKIVDTERSTDITVNDGSYSITYGPNNPQWGTLTVVDEAGNPVRRLMPGQKGTVIPEPKEGYVVDRVYISKQDEQTVEALPEPYQFTMPDYDIRIIVSFMAAPTVLETGSCGDNLTWTLYSDRSLTISGTGNMTDYASAEETPWFLPYMNVGPVDHNGGVHKLTLEEGITSIGDHAFEGQIWLTSVTVPATVTRIGERAFFAAGLSNLVMQDGLTSIGESAFGSCPNLTTVHIPDSVETLGGYAFSFCGKLTDVNYPRSLGSSSHEGDGETPQGYGYTFLGCPITSMTVPEGATVLQIGIFQGMETLTEVSLPDSLQQIEAWAFDSCSSLTEITIPAGVKVIGYGAFQNCSALETVRLNEGLLTIEKAAFNHCTALESIYLPKSLQRFDSIPFVECSALKTVYYGGSEEEWEAIKHDIEYGYDVIPENVEIVFNSVNKLPSFTAHFNVPYGQKELSLGETWIVDASVAVTGGSGYLGRVTVNAEYYDNSNMTEDFTGKNLASVNLASRDTFTIDTTKEPWNTPGIYHLRIWAKDSNGVGGTTPLDSVKLTVVDLNSYIIGTVKTESGIGIEDVYVTLQNTTDSTDMIMTATDANGNWKIANAAKGAEYSVNYYHKDFSVSGNENIVQLGDTTSATGTLNGDSIYAERKYVLLAADGDPENLRVLSNKDWTCHSNQDWINLAQTEDTISISASVNSGVLRYGSFTMNNGTAEQTVYVYQKGTTTRLPDPAILTPAQDYEEVEYGDLHITWTAVEGADNYVISLREINSNTLLLCHTSAGNVTEANLSTSYFDSKCTYRLAVGAVAAGTESTDSITGWSERILVVKGVETPDNYDANGFVYSISEEAVNSAWLTAASLPVSDDVMVADVVLADNLTPLSGVNVSVYAYNDNPTGNEVALANCVSAADGGFTIPKLTKGVKYRISVESTEYKQIHGYVFTASESTCKDIKLYCAAEGTVFFGSMGVSLPAWSEQGKLHAEFFRTEKDDPKIKDAFTGKLKAYDDELETPVDYTFKTVTQPRNSYGQQLSATNNHSNKSTIVPFISQKFALCLNGYIKLGENTKDNTYRYYKFRLSGDDGFKLTLNEMDIISDWGRVWGLDGKKTEGLLNIPYLDGSVLPISIYYYNRKADDDAELKMEYTTSTDGKNWNNTWQLVPGDWFYSGTQTVFYAGTGGFDFDEMAETEKEAKEIVKEYTEMYTLNGLRAKLKEILSEPVEFFNDLTSKGLYGMLKEKLDKLNPATIIADRWDKTSADERRIWLGHMYEYFGNSWVKEVLEKMENSNKVNGSDELASFYSTIKEQYSHNTLNCHVWNQQLIYLSTVSVNDLAALVYGIDTSMLMLDKAIIWAKEIAGLVDDVIS